MVDPNNTGGYESRLAEQVEALIDKADSLAGELSIAMDALVGADARERDIETLSALCEEHRAGAETQARLRAESELRFDRLMFALGCVPSEGVDAGEAKAAERAKLQQENAILKRCNADRDRLQQQVIEQGQALAKAVRVVDASFKSLGDAEAARVIIRDAVRGALRARDTVDQEPSTVWERDDAELQALYKIAHGLELRRNFEDEHPTVIELRGDLRRFEKKHYARNGVLGLARPPSPAGLSAHGGEPLPADSTETDSSLVEEAKASTPATAGDLPPSPWPSEIIEASNALLSDPAPLTPSTNAPPETNRHPAEAGTDGGPAMQRTPAVGEAGPFVVTRRDRWGRRFWRVSDDGVWCEPSDIEYATKFAREADVVARRPRGSRVVALAYVPALLANDADKARAVEEHEEAERRFT